MRLDENAGSTLTDRIYRKVREEILAGTLEPGLRLRVEALKQRYDCGASPLREALSRLSGDGLVVIEERRGFAVAGISLEELWDVTKTRVILETAALSQAIRNSGHGAESDAWEAAILAAFHRLEKLDRRLGKEEPTLEWESLHGEFHEKLVSGCGLRKLQQCRVQMFEQSERYRRLSLTRSIADRDVSGEHKAIMDATLDRDEPRACQLLAEHIRRTAGIVAAAVEAGKASPVFNADESAPKVGGMAERPYGGAMAEGLDLDRRVGRRRSSLGTRGGLE